MARKKRKSDPIAAFVYVITALATGLTAAMVYFIRQ